MQLKLKSANTLVIAFMLGFALIIFFLTTSFLEFPSPSSSNPSADEIFLFSTLSRSAEPEPFKDLLKAFNKWDSQMGCSQFRAKHTDSLGNGSKISSLQNVGGAIQCGELQMNHVSVLVKGWTWIPDNLDNLYSCRCGLSCLWTKSPVLADKPDALLFETTTPPFQRRTGDPLRVYMDLEADGGLFGCSRKGLCLNNFYELSCCREKENGVRQFKTVLLQPINESCCPI